jgi:anaerobic ribonucleoside-triphosphate reductase|nr:MAG TPA: anaerobic ribonucleoside triphosphate reductase [Caudoviricetes sp.]
MGKSAGGTGLNINVRLSKNFTTQYNKMQEKYGEEFAELNGFSDKQLSFTDFINNFIDTETVADASIDSSANVGNKDMRTLLNEMPKSHRKLLAFNKIYYELNKKYGFQCANDWLDAEWSRALYLHDADTSTFKPYCFAYTLERLAEEGLFFLNNFNYEPARHLTTFVDFVKEFVSYTSNLTSGACGLPDLIPYMYYFWSRDVANNYYTESPETYARQNIQRLIYAVNQPAVRDSIQSAFTNVNFFDTPYLIALFGGKEFPDGKPMIDELDGIMEFQKMFLVEMSDIRAKNMFTFPVSSISLIYKDGHFEDEEFARWAVRHNMKWSDSNLFTSDSVTSLSNCCRLKSNIRDLGFFSSIGGTALRVGSVKVSTINLARIAYESESEQDYLCRLRDRTELDLRVLDTVRHIIQRDCEKGLLPNYDDGLIDMASQYNTIGIIGIYETMKHFGYIRLDEMGNTFYTEEADNFGRRIFEVINMTKEQFVLDKDYKISIEQIPGESAAAKLQQADEYLFPDKVVKDLPLYGNQFIPLGIKTTMKERIRIAALFDSYCNGGSIAHLNLDAPFNSFEQAWDMTNYIASQGLTYFAFNTKIQACKHNHGFYGSICPACGEPVATEYTRIAGFYTPVRTWSRARKEEFKMREWEDVNK